VRSYRKALEKGITDMMVIPNRVRVLAVMVALALVGGLLTLALLAKPSQAQPPTDTENRGAETHRFEIDTNLAATDCIGEDIRVTGTVHQVGQFFETDGGYHFTLRGSLSNGRAVGLTSGEEYIVTSTGGFTENFLPTGDTVFSSVDMQHVVGKGRADNLVFHSRVHYIIEVVDGEPTVKMENIEFFTKCQG
jgi:hypothetical protein